MSLEVLQLGVPVVSPRIVYIRICIENRFLIVIVFHVQGRPPCL